MSQLKHLSFSVALCLLLIVTLVGCSEQEEQRPPPTQAAELTLQPEPAPVQAAPTKVALAPQVTVIAEGLINPVGMAELPGGGLLVAEEGSGENDNSAGVSLITADGEMGRLISGLPSGRDAGDLSGVPLVAVSEAGDKLYLAHFQFSDGHLWTLDLPQDAPLTLRKAPYTVNDLTPEMLPSGNVFLVNPFDMTFDPDGSPVVTDASGNGVAKETADGQTRFFHRFADLTDPANEQMKIDAVPTGITRVGSEYFVTLTGGCPYPAGSGLLVAIDEERSQRTLVDGLHMPIDVAQGPDGTIWVLEFARFDPEGSCFSGADYLPGTGRLSRLRDDNTLEPVLTDLNFPGAVLPDAAGNLYISEIFDGRISYIQFTPGAKPPISRAPAVTPEPGTGLTLRFRDVAPDVGLDFTHGAFRTGMSADPVAMMGAGLCWIDYDHDGWLDLYLVNSHALAEDAYWQENGGLPQNALFRNDSGQFVDVSEATRSNLALRGNGCVAADFNLDGHTDIYVTADGPNALLWNNGDGTFSEGAAAAGLAAPEWNSAAAVGDINKDGWPDLFVAAYIDLNNKIEKPSGAFPQDYYGLPDRLYLNQKIGPDGRATFREITRLAGLEREERGLGAVFVDVDRDNDLDLYIANDGHPNRLYELQQSTEDPGLLLQDVTRTAGVGDSGSGMGIAAGDYDGNGLPDLFITNWEAEINALYQNRSDTKPDFRYSTFRIGLGSLGSGLTGWGTTWADFDHDTDLDLLVVHGRVPITNLQADADLVRFYGNRLAQGAPDQFRNWTAEVGLEEIGPLMSRGSALADFDNDGDLDVAINTIGGTAVLLENSGVQENWLQIGFDGFYPGTVVTVTLDDGTELVRDWHVGSSYLASEDPRLHFGVGDQAIIPQIEVRWPNGLTRQLQDIPANQQLKLSPRKP
ncbi:MAG: ScyD/ScyE family protein [Candidatus Promineifilaceae bacterium]|nr:ScyD/ScyE family protein [Candidatus Promineifilaceae bacterium]